MDEHSTSPRKGAAQRFASPAGVAIVPMHHEHIDALAELESAAFSRPWSYDALAEELQNPLAVFFVAEDVAAEKAIGYIGMHHILDEGFITNIVVHPGYRRTGIGSSLLKEAMEYAETKEMDRLTLEVRQSNAEAAALYERHGFEPDGVRPGFYDSPKEDAVIYSYYL